MIRKAGVDDVRFCHELTAIEDWNYTAEEIRAMVTNEDTDFYIAEKKGEKRGMAAAFRYGDSAWIGLVIVSREYRGQGVGTALVEEVLKKVKSQGVTTVRLESVPEAVSLYERLGFTPEFESLRLRGTCRGKNKKSSPLSKDMLKDICEFDQKYFGVRRDKFLEKFFALSPIRLVDADTRVKGYLLVRSGFGFKAPCKIGPCVCEDVTSCELLLKKALSQLKGPVSLGIPAPNTEGVDLLERYGFTITGASLRMVWGKKEYCGVPEKIFAIGGPEKG